MNVSPDEGNMIEVEGSTPGFYPKVYEYSQPVDVTIQAVPAEGYTFLYWKGCVQSSENPVTIGVDSGKSITAYFTYSGKLYGAVKGRIWKDRNKDGVQEYMHHIENVSDMEVELRNADGELVATTVADEGYYHFSDVEYGRYYVFFDIPSPYVFTPKDQAHETMDSDADGTGKTDLFEIGEETDVVYLDAGVFETDSSHLEISVSEVGSLAEQNSDLVIVDVREPDEFCEGHIQDALNMPWNSGYFIQNYTDLPSDNDILVVCRSGHRSRHAAEFLDSHGYSSVYIYNLETGMISWDLGVLSCYQGEPALFYQHIAAGSGFDTEIGFVNKSDERTVSGIFRGYDQKGAFVSESDLVQLNPRARLSFSVKDLMTNAAAIQYIVFESVDTGYEAVAGYAKYYFPGGYCSALPAKKSAATEDFHVSHIASDEIWSTGIALLNPGPQDKELEIELNTLQKKTILLPAFGHTAFTFGSLFGDMLPPQTGLHSASIGNSAGVMGMQIFGRLDKNAYGAVSLSESAANVLAYPLVAEDEKIWSGIVVYNTSEQACDLVIKPYTAGGEALEEQTATLGKHGKLIGTRSTLQLPPETEHVQIQGTRKITGFMLVGNGERIGGGEFLGTGAKQGVLPRLEKNGWTSIVLVNHGDEPVEVTLDAYADNGSRVESNTLNLEAHEQNTIDPSEFFASGIGEAGYVSFTSTGEVGALQLNGSDEKKRFDLLPAL